MNQEPTTTREIVHVRADEVEVVVGSDLDANQRRDEIVRVAVEKNLSASHGIRNAGAVRPKVTRRLNALYDDWERDPNIDLDAIEARQLVDALAKEKPDPRAFGAVEYSTLASKASFFEDQPARPPRWVSRPDPDDIDVLVQRFADDEREAGAG